MSERSGRLRERARESFLAEDLDPRLPRVEMIGDRRVFIENHRGIIEYSDTMMRVALAGSELRIIGAAMELRTLTLTEMTIAGTICALEYVAAGGQKEGT